MSVKSYLFLSNLIKMLKSQLHLANINNSAYAKSRTTASLMRDGFVFIFIFFLKKKKKKTILKEDPLEARNTTKTRK